MMLLRYSFCTGKATVLPYFEYQTRVEKGPPLTTAGSRCSEQSGAHWQASHTDTVPQQRGYNTAGISDETVSKGCQ